MKKGICLTALYPEAMENATLLMELFEKIKGRDLFDCVEFYFHGRPEEELQIGERLRTMGLSSVFLAGFPIKRDKVDISSQDEKKRLAGVEECRKLYESAVRLQSDKMLIISGPSWKDEDRAGIIRQTQKSLREIEQQTRSGEPQLSLEFFNDKGEPWLAVGEIDLVKELFKGMPGTRIGITFDTSHTAQLGADVLTAFETLRPWICHLHLANSVSRDRSHPMFGDKHPLFATEGGDFSMIEIREIYGTLEHRGYLEQVNVCSVEVISRGEEDQYFEKTCEEAKFIWGSI